MSANTEATKKIRSIFQEIQYNRLTHQRNTATLISLYDAIPFEDFIRVFMNCIRIMFGYSTENGNVLSCMKFVSGFVTKIAERDDAKKDSEEDPTHPLLRRVIIEVLKYHSRDDFKLRYHACNLITLLLDSIDENANLDNDLCDEIQEAMLDRIHDPKAIIREKAIEALQRLQDPCNKECPVISAYLDSFRDVNPVNRAAVIKVVAPYGLSLSKIVESVHDVDPKVRLQAFLKLSQLKPNCLKIIERQAVLQSGFDELNKPASKVFREMLIPKWLSAYEGNYLLLLKAIKLDADEQDIENTDEISNKIMEVFLKTHTIQDLLNYLPLNEDKLIPYDKLLTEVGLFWNIMLQTLSKKLDTEDTVVIVPDLLPFCKYIDEYITEKNNKEMEVWQFLEYQFILLKLFDMVRTFDLSDEAGRKVLYQLVTETLLKRSLGKPVTSMLLSILEKLNPDLDSLIGEVIDIIRNILDPIVEAQPTKECLREYNFKLAELDLKINILHEEIEEAIVKRDMKVAYQSQEELKVLKAEKAELQSKLGETKQEKQHTNDPAQKCKTFDILNSLLELESLTKLSNELKLFRKEVLTEMETFTDIEHHKRAFKTCCLYSLLDRECTQEYLKFIYSPILVYRTMPELAVVTLQRSMMTICDLLCLYGPQFFKSDECDNTSSTMVSKRKLYNPDLEENETVNQSQCSAEFLIEIFISMLASDVHEIKETACKVLARLVYAGVCTTSGLFTRVLIEWCNPVNLVNPNIQTMLGVAMFNYAYQFQDSQVVIENAVIPALNIIGNAPKTSPLADINVDHVIKFMCNLTRPLNPNSIANTHKNLAYMLCKALDKNLESKCAIIWVKMILSLELPQNDTKTFEELKTQIEDLLEDVKNSAVRNKLRKYHGKLTLKLKQETEILSEMNSDVNSSSNLLQQEDRDKSDKRLASESDTERSPINPKKKTKLSGENEIDADDANARNSVKRALNNSASSQEESESDTKQMEKRQKLQDFISSGKELQVVLHPHNIDDVINKSTISEHDKENMVQGTKNNKNGANILQNIVLKSSWPIEPPAKKDSQPSRKESPSRNNGGFSKNKSNDNTSDTNLSSSTIDRGKVNKKRKKKLKKAKRIEEKNNDDSAGTSSDEDKKRNSKEKVSDNKNNPEMVKEDEKKQTHNEKNQDKRSIGNDDISDKPKRISGVNNKPEIVNKVRKISTRSLSRDSNNLHQKSVKRSRKKQSDKEEKKSSKSIKSSDITSSEEERKKPKLFENVDKRKGIETKNSSREIIKINNKQQEGKTRLSNYSNDVTSENNHNDDRGGKKVSKNVSIVIKSDVKKKPNKHNRSVRNDMTVIKYRKEKNVGSSDRKTRSSLGSEVDKANNLNNSRQLLVENAIENRRRKKKADKSGETTTASSSSGENRNKTDRSPRNKSRKIESSKVPDSKKQRSLRRGKDEKEKESIENVELRNSSDLKMNRNHKSLNSSIITRQKDKQDKNDVSIRDDRNKRNTINKKIVNSSPNFSKIRTSTPRSQFKGLNGLSESGNINRRFSRNAVKEKETSKRRLEYPSKSSENENAVDSANRRSRASDSGSKSVAVSREREVRSRRRVEDGGTLKSDRRKRKGLARKNLKPSDDDEESTTRNKGDFEDSRNESLLNTSADSLRNVKVEISRIDTETANTHLKLLRKTESKSERDNHCRSSDRIAKQIKFCTKKKSLRFHRNAKRII